MNNVSALKAQITALFEDQYENPRLFANFASDALKLGVTRLTFDALKDEMSFYTKDQFIHSLPRKDLLAARKTSTWTLGETLDVPKLEHAIQQLDAGKMEAPEFHRQIFAAGVIFCNVYMDLRKIYYMGQDGQYYLEKY